MPTPLERGHGYVTGTRHHRELTSCTPSPAKQYGKCQSQPHHHVGRQLASARESVRLDSARFSPQAFDKHWNELADGGGFNCRVARIPEIAVLARHLHDHDFIVVSDGLGVSQQRTVLFYAEDLKTERIQDSCSWASLSR
ncbi:hypothetical protein GQ600_8331 [Phytophthora cactorum]|nr:hypothetical protein GQ600_8331 [Phytophthora cactorum]